MFTEEEKAEIASEIKRKRIEEEEKKKAEENFIKIKKAFVE